MVTRAVLNCVLMQTNFDKNTELKEIDHFRHKPLNSEFPSLLLTFWNLIKILNKKVTLRNGRLVPYNA